VGGVREREGKKTSGARRCWAVNLSSNLVKQCSLPCTPTSKIAATKSEAAVDSGEERRARQWRGKKKSAKCWRRRGSGGHKFSLFLGTNEGGLGV
jgi:hypothetical protein